MVPLILDLQAGWCCSPGAERLELLLHGCAVWRVGAAVEPRDAENEDFFFFSHGCADADVSYSAELDKVILGDLRTI